MTLAEIKALIDTYYPDNTTGLITPAWERLVHKAMADFVVSSQGEVDNAPFVYDPAFTYDAGDPVIYDAAWYLSLAGSNLNNQPDESPSEWQPINAENNVISLYETDTVYLGDLTIVVKEWAMYFLDRDEVGDVPFVSTDFDAELAANKWVPLLPDSTPVLGNYADTTEMIAAQGSQVEGYFYKAGTALYIYLGTTDGDIDDYYSVTGTPGADGDSAYDIAVAGGFIGTEEEWLESLVGPPGDPGDPGAPGADGDSAYEIAVAGGFVGTEEEWLESLVGPEGPPGDAMTAEEIRDELETLTGEDKLSASALKDLPTGEKFEESFTWTSGPQEFTMSEAYVGDPTVFVGTAQLRKSKWTRSSAVVTITETLYVGALVTLVYNRSVLTTGYPEVNLSAENFFQLVENGTVYIKGGNVPQDTSGGITLTFRKNTMYGTPAAPLSSTISEDFTGDHVPNVGAEAILWYNGATLDFTSGAKYKRIHGTYGASVLNKIIFRYYSDTYITYEIYQEL